MFAAGELVEVGFQFGEEGGELGGQGGEEGGLCRVEGGFGEEFEMLGLVGLVLAVDYESYQLQKPL